MERSTKYRYLRLTALGYFFLLSGFNFFRTLLNVGFKWLDFVLLLACCLPLVFRKSFVYYSFGTLALLLSLYMLLAVYSDYIDYQNGKPMADRLLYFGVGNLFFFSSAVFSIIMVCLGVGLKNNESKTRIAMQGRS